jgi:hypothetical protein
MPKQAICNFRTAGINGYNYSLDFHSPVPWWICEMELRVFWPAPPASASLLEMAG